MKCGRSFAFAVLAGAAIAGEKTGEEGETAGEELQDAYKRDKK